MGLFGRKSKDGVRGTARVVSSSQPPHATHGSLRMTLVVEAPGIPAYSHDYSKFAVRVDKWPSPGDVLPVSVDPGDPRQVEVLWDEIPRVRDAARHEAEQMAAMLRQQQQGAAPGQPPTADVAGGHDVAGIVGQLQQMFPGAVVNVEGNPTAGHPPAAFPATPGQPEAAPPPPGQPGAAPPVPGQPAAAAPAPGQPGAVPPMMPGTVHVVADQSDADPVERLEKLARLRDAGIVDQAQFEQLKAQILGQAGLADP